MTDKQPTGLVARQAIQKAMTITREKIVPMEFKEKLFEIIEVNIEIKELNPIFHDYKIINLSDLHLGQWLTPEYLEGVIDIVNKQNPDMVALTGDYVSYILEDVEEDLEKSLKRLNPKDISLAVLGNHDHWIGPEKIKSILKNANIKNISNDVYTLKRTNKNNEESSLHIAGVDSMMLDKEDINIVMSKLPDEGPAIMLAHEPDFADIAATTGRFALQISGHSHGGQFIIPGLNTTILRGSYSQKYPVGEYQIGDMVQYTNKGLGTNVFWLRINCAPEITVFRLKSPEINRKNGIENKTNKNKVIQIKKEKSKLIKNIDNYIKTDEISQFINDIKEDIEKNLNLKNND